MANSKIEKKISGSNWDRFTELHYYNPSLDVSLTTDVGTSWHVPISFYDKNKKESFKLYDFKSSSSLDRGIQLDVYRYINNTKYTNTLILSINKNGIPGVYVNSPAAWRDAIITIYKQGDTIIDGDGLIYKNSILDYTQTNNGQASGTYGITMNKIVDKNNKIGMGAANYIRSDGSIEMLLYAKNYNTSGNETYTNIFGIGVDKSKPYFRIGYPSQFRDALQTSRFHGSVTITDTNLVTITNSKIKANHYLVNYVIQRPWNLSGQMTWTTYDGKITFKANSIGGNGIILYFDLMESEELV